MIIPMTKYTFILYHVDYEPFLKNLQGLGVLHIIRKSKTKDPSLKYLDDIISEYNSHIKPLRVDCKGIEIPPSDDERFSYEEYKKVLSEKENYQQRKSALQKDIEMMTPWGNFSWDTVRSLKKSDICMHFYSCTHSRFNRKWAEENALSIINDSGTTIQFVIFTYAGEEVASIDAEVVTLPTDTLSELDKQMSEVEKNLARINSYLKENKASFLSKLLLERSYLLRKLEYDDNQMQSEQVADEQITVLQGWSSEKDKEELERFLNEENICYYSDTPTEEDNPPILLKNNWFAKLFEPIGKLYSLPSYMELDLTAFFAPFFMLFFGFCTADFGYGLAIFTAASIGKWKVKSPEIRPLLTLVQFLGASTTIMGFVMGSILGFDLKEWTAIGDLVPIRSNDQVFKFALVLGVVQILFGVIMNFANRVRSGGFKTGISMIGTFLFILNVTILASPVMGGHPGQLAVYAKYGVYLALFLIFFFNAPGKNIFINVALGLWEMYNIITGFFGDLLSYIRLFALGVSGGILGIVVNSMAMQFRAIPIIGFLIMLLVMIVGHSANIALSALGGFVHPMRLTFVEFYKNSGFNGGGKEYKPFGKKK